MKYLGVDYGWLIEGFSILPSISIVWARADAHTKLYDVQFAWLRWYFTIGQVHKWLKENNYH